ncbi:MAG: hypothetical protein LBT33_11345 [Spirochaetia bacterium]|jgi:hypothetical protein|nr:hypothetical protein [Spirochaetia bacterium]
MKKFLLLVCTGVLVASCAGGPGVQQSSRQEATASAAEAADPPPARLEEIHSGGHWVTRPSKGTLTVIGIAGRRSNKDEAVAAALADAARKVTLYHGVYGESATVLNQGSGNLDYYADFDYRLSFRNTPESFINDLVFDKDSDVLEKDGAVYVRTKYSGVLDVPDYSSAMEDGAPNWVKNYSAVIPGFLAGVGTSKNKGSIPKTYEASYENAIASLLPGLSTKVAGESVDVTGAKLTTNITVSRGSLTNVMILETWFDRKTGAVWTLLAAKPTPE